MNVVIVAEETETVAIVMTESVVTVSDSEQVVVIEGSDDELPTVR